MADLANSPVPFRTLTREGGTIGLDPGGVGATLGFHVGQQIGGQPTDVIDFLTFVGGTTESVTIGGVSVERIVPLRHPYFPSMIAVAARAEKTGKGIDAPPGWTDWKVLVDFAVVPYSFGGDQPYLTIRRNIGATSITLPGRAYAVSGVFMNHDIAKNIMEIVYSVTKYNVPSLDDSVYRSLAGKINSAAFLGAPAKTVRFDGVQDEINMTIGFAINRTVTLAVTYRPLSWNAVVLPTGVVAEPVNVDDGAGLHETADFNQLLY